MLLKQLFREDKVLRTKKCNCKKADFVEYAGYSPAAIIRIAKIWNIILLHAFIRTLSSNLDLEYPAVPEDNCLKNLLPLP